MQTPALALDLDRLESNLRRMANRASALGVSLRPHIKTHKCIEIARMQMELGASGITVSTLYEAQVFAEHGFDDITWAYPVIINRIPEVLQLAERVRLGVVVDSAAAVEALGKTEAPLRVWLKVDCGYHRAGVDPQSDETIRIAASISQDRRLFFCGILSHSGHAYNARSVEEAAAVAEEERSVMVALAERLRGGGIQVPDISVGSTPAMCAARHLDGVTEARPGNYAFFDYTQVAIGSCTARECAVTVSSSVVSSQPNASHCIVDAGALALSKDLGPGKPVTLGEIYRDYNAGMLEPEMRLISVSQEHGHVNQALTVGDKIRILPNHSCLTVAQFDTMHVLRDNKVVDEWKIWRGRD